jgi:hypothetical protein
MKVSLKIAFIIVIYCFCFLSAGILRAEETGEIQGRVTDVEGEALPGVGITAKSPSLQGERTAVSDKNGNFRLPLLPVGEYSLTYELDGFEKLTTTGNRVYLGATLSVTVTLKMAAISEEVVVTAQNPLIDKTKADNSSRLTGETLVYVPTQTRTIAEVVSTTPGVTGVRANSEKGSDSGLPSFRGAGDAGNNWLVDGLSFQGANNNHAATQISYDAWDEIQIISDGFSPELGQAMGGFVNIVTKSGGNTYHGELGGLLRDSHLRANRQEQLSVATLPETSLSDFYGNLGGPVLKDKLWFFLSNNYHYSSDITQEQTLGWLTIPSGERRVNTDNIFGKVTYTPRINHTLSLSAVLDTFLGQKGGIGLPETYEEKDYTDYAFRLNYRGILSQNTLLTAALGQYKTEWEFVVLEDHFETPAYYWMDIGQITNCKEYETYGEDQRRIDLALNLTQYLSLGSWGEHEIGLGLFYNNKKGGWHASFPGRGFDPWPGNGFENGVLIIWEAPGIPSILEEYGPARPENSSDGIGLYIGDTVSIGRFSLMLGLRAETQTVYNNEGDPIWKWGLGDFLTPRLSLAVDILGDGKNILKFGFGRFAQPHTLGFLGFFNTEFAVNLRDYFWIGGENPSEAELKDPSNWEFFFEQSGGAMTIAVDPDLKPNKATRWLLEFDRQFGMNWALKLRGVYAEAKNLATTVNYFDPVLIENIVYTNFDRKRRNYKALEVELNGRIAQDFMLSASYTWSQAKGTSPGNWQERMYWGTEWAFSLEGGGFGFHPDVPEGDPNKESLDWVYQGLGGPGAVGDEGWYGYLPYSIDHMVKILGTYFAPYGFVISTAIEYLSGYYWEKKGFSPGQGAFVTFPEGRGSRTTPAHMYIDLAVEREFVLKGLRLNVGVNVYNLLNSQHPVSYVKEDTALFGEVWARQLPRWLQIKAAVRF